MESTEFIHYHGQPSEDIGCGLTRSGKDSARSAYQRYSMHEGIPLRLSNQICTVTLRPQVGPGAGDDDELLKYIFKLSFVRHRDKYMEYPVKIEVNSWRILEIPVV